MKSQTQTFTGLYYALSRDIALQYPSIKSDLDRDLSRLQRALNHEGLSFITIVHLDMCTFFQKALALEDFDHPSLGARPRGYGKKGGCDRDVRPCYLHGLTSMIFAEDGKLLPDPDVSAIYFVRQWLLMAKKLEIQCDDARTEQALSDFLAIEARLPDHRPGTWDHDDPCFQRVLGHPLWGAEQTDPVQDLFGEPRTGDGVDWGLYRQICDLVSSAIGTLDPWQLRPKHGPGAVADDGSPLKYDFKFWPRKLQQVFPWDYHASSDLGYYAHAFSSEPEEREFPSVVLHVPKTQKAPRIICKEPIAHQWIQGGIERFLYKRIRSTFLRDCFDYQNQDLSQEMALEGSRTGAYATVDLSAASDRISTRLVDYLFGRVSDNSLLEALHACRTRYFKLGETHSRFRKFAPMGSACTFPVQSILFASFAALAICQSHGLRTPREIEGAFSRFRVFGDDIIIPTDSIGVLCEALASAGLKVNEGKSFSTGLFRESCGMDAFAGVDITPTYVKHLYSPSSPSSLKAVVDTANNFFRSGLWHCARFLLETVPTSERKLLTVVPIVKRGRKLVGQDDGAVSLHSFSGGSTDHLKKRWNDDLHRYEVDTLTLTTKSVREQSDGAAGLIQYFTEVPSPETEYQSGQVRRSTTTKHRGRALATSQGER